MPSSQTQRPTAHPSYRVSAQAHISPLAQSVSLYKEASFLQQYHRSLPPPAQTVHCPCQPSPRGPLPSPDPSPVFSIFPVADPPCRKSHDLLSVPAAPLSVACAAGCWGKPASAYLMSSYFLPGTRREEIHL